MFTGQMSSLPRELYRDRNDWEPHRLHGNLVMMQTDVGELL